MASVHTLPAVASHLFPCASPPLSGHPLAKTGTFDHALSPTAQQHKVACPPCMLPSAMPLVVCAPTPLDPPFDMSHMLHLLAPPSRTMPFYVAAFAQSAPLHAVCSLASLHSSPCLAHRERPAHAACWVAASHVSIPSPAQTRVHVLAPSSLAPMPLSPPHPQRAQSLLASHACRCSHPHRRAQSLLATLAACIATATRVAAAPLAGLRRRPSARLRSLPSHSTLLLNRLHEL